MNKIYNCEYCKKEYKTYMGLWKHNKKYHNETSISEILNNISNICKYCNKILSCKQSRWRHEQKCKEINNIALVDRVDELTQKIKVLEQKPNSIVNNTNNTTNNTTNIQYVINSPTASNIDHLSFDLQKDVLDKGLNSLVYLIELINFNKSVPENHSYCITALNDKHASVIDEKTNKIIKTNKFDLFDKVLGSNLDNLEKMSNNPNFTTSQRREYTEKINYLRNMMFQNNKFIKRYQNDINLLSYNNKDMIKETWKSLKNDNDDEEEEEEYGGDRPKGFDDLIEQLSPTEKPDFLKNKTTTNTTTNTKNKTNKFQPINVPGSDLSDTDSDTEACDCVEIRIKGVLYILEDNQVYVRTKKGTRGELYGTYSNGKVKKIQSKEIKL